MYRHHGNKLFPIPTDLVKNSLHTHFIKCDICDGGASGMIYITYCSFVVVAIKYFLVTLDRCSTTITIYRKSVIVNGSL